MKILGIETSCDETAISVIEANSPARSGQAVRVRVLSNIVSSQVKLHAKFGGVVPHLAKREHQRNLAPVLMRALEEAESLKLETGKKKKEVNENHNSRFQILYSILEREPELLKRFKKHIVPLKPPKIDAIAVTVGPGLAPALWVGVNFARALSFLWSKPVIPVNHLEGHIYTNLLPQGERIAHSVKRISRRRRSIPYPLTPIHFPALCLIVSGGHTELVLMSGYGKYRIIGETLDDAAGEAFDKAAKMMRLGFPGGPAIAAMAGKKQKAKIKKQNGDAKFKITLPRPMLRSKNYDFSFSGLKTAVLYLLRGHPELLKSRRGKAAVAKEFQNAVVDVLVAKTIRAARQYRVKTVMIGGGVSANEKLRAELGEALRRSCPGTSYLAPSLSLTGDNALMIALAGYFNRNKKSAQKNIRADPAMRLGTAILSNRANLRLDSKRKL